MRFAGENDFKKWLDTPGNTCDCGFPEPGAPLAKLLWEQTGCRAAGVAGYDVPSEDDRFHAVFELQVYALLHTAVTKAFGR